VGAKCPEVSVVGDFNHWMAYPCHAEKIPAGIWEIFVPNVGEGTHYKFRFAALMEEIFLKTGPFASFAQHGRGNRLHVYDINRYTWSDAEWMKNRSRECAMPRSK